MDRSRVKLLIVAAVIIAAFSYLYMSGMEASQVYYLTVSEYHASSSQIGPGEAFRISGRVQPDTVALDSTGLDVQFSIFDPAHPGIVMPVSYKGVIPDTFMENSEVVVEGAMVADLFVAHTLLAKCPSKYEGMADEEARREAEGRDEAANPTI